MWAEREEWAWEVGREWWVESGARGTADEVGWVVDRKKRRRERSKERSEELSRREAAVAATALSTGETGES